jgi:hypothetical protein
VTKLLSSLLTLLLLITVASSVQSQQTKSTETFASFWVKFKAAVAKNDKEAIADMTNFPIYIGEELTRDAFVKKYNEIFDRNVKRCLARAKPTNDYQAYLNAVKLTKKQNAPPPQPQEDTGSYSVFCGGEIYVFQIVGGKYKFAEIGVND